MNEPHTDPLTQRVWLGWSGRLADGNRGAVRRGSGVPNGSGSARSRLTRVSDTSTTCAKTTRRASCRLCGSW